MLLVQSHVVFAAVQAALRVGKVVLQAFEIGGAFGNGFFIFRNFGIQLFGTSKRFGNGFIKRGNVGRTAHYAGFEGG